MALCQANAAITIAATVAVAVFVATKTETPFIDAVDDEFDLVAIGEDAVVDDTFDVFHVERSALGHQSLDKAMHMFGAHSPDFGHRGMVDAFHNRVGMDNPLLALFRLFPLLSLFPLRPV